MKRQYEADKWQVKYVSNAFQNNALYLSILGLIYGDQSFITSLGGGGFSGAGRGR